MPFKVSDKYRSILSKQPGGCNVVIKYFDGKELLYDKVKNPEAYINKALSNDPNIIRIAVNGIIWYEG